jgi:hypothetical protein
MEFKGSERGGRGGNSLKEERKERKDGTLFLSRQSINDHIHC